MPKAKGRKKGGAQGNSAQTRAQADAPALASPLPPPAARVAKRPAAASPGLSSLLTAAMVALGCWGFAFTFAFLTNDPNRYLFGGLAALVALMWTVSFGVRLRKLQQKR